MTPPTSSVAYTSWGRAGSDAMRITRQANPIRTRSGSTALGSLRKLSPPSSLLKTPTGEVPT
jgi:hypothetical protein